MTLPQADASTLVDGAEVERRVHEMDRAVGRDPLAARHFETGRSLALRLGYPASLLDAITASSPTGRSTPARPAASRA